MTSRGGMTSHAAIVARGMGKTCVVGAKEIEVDPAAGRFRANGRVVKRGQILTVDGTTGQVILGAAKLVLPKIGTHYEQLMRWADARRRLRVRTNADTPADAQRAREFGAEGIGLCRTEHMFFEGDRITAMREMIVAPDEAGRRRALAKLLPMQRADFEGIFEAMVGYPVTIRLLDPPLHEFLPHTKERAGRARQSDEAAPAPSQGAGGRVLWRRTRCSAIAAAGWASPIPKSPRCRPGRFSRRPVASSRAARRSSSRS